MRKLVSGLLFLVILFASSKVFAASYCPTPDEFKAKNLYFQQQAVNVLSNKDYALEAAEKLQLEQSTYMDSVYPNCVQYFKNTKNPDCSKLVTLATGYMLMSDAERASSKSEVLNVAKPFATRCSAQFHTLEILLK